jgi:hypothetical protein
MLNAYPAIESQLLDDSYLIQRNGNCRKGLPDIDTTKNLIMEFSECVRQYGLVDRHIRPTGHKLVDPSLAPAAFDTVAGKGDQRESE